MTALPDAAEDFDAVAALYDDAMDGNNLIHDLIYPRVYGEGEYIGQFSDNSASELAAMASATGLGAGSRVLDIGCGTAPVATFFAQHFGWHVTGIDVSASPLRKARQRVAEAGLGDQVTLVAGDVYRFPFLHKFDGGYGAGAFCHFDPARLFARAALLLRPGGKLAFMERVRTGEFTSEEWDHLTTKWACPTVTTTGEYRELLEANDFRVDQIHDLTPAFRDWQNRSVVVRQELRAEILRLTSEDYYETSVQLADYENAVTKAGKLGYAMIVATNGV